MDVQEIKYSELNEILKAYFSNLYGGLFTVLDVDSYLAEENRYDWDGDKYKVKVVNAEIKYSKTVNLFQKSQKVESVVELNSSQICEIFGKELKKNNCKLYSLRSTKTGIKLNIEFIITDKDKELIKQNDKKVLKLV